MSREVTDAMVRAAAEVYLGEVFLPEDITDKQNSGALMLARKVLEAALSASPTRAQAASAGEPVAFPRDASDAMLVVLNSSLDGAKKWARLVRDHAAATDGRSPNDVVAAYREVTKADAKAIDRYAKDWDKSSPREENDDTCLFAALQHFHAVIRVSDTDRIPEDPQQ